MSALFVGSYPATLTKRPPCGEASALFAFRSNPASLENNREEPMAGESPSMEADPVSSSKTNVLLATILGTTIEWYDFNIYGIAAALVFGPHFFPKLSDTAGTIAAFATFAIGFVARPFGAALFGHFGDRVGRKQSLVYSILLVGLGTFFIGLLPTYEDVGVWAPILLVTCRVIQG